MKTVLTWLATSTISSGFIIPMVVKTNDVPNIIFNTIHYKYEKDFGQGQSSNVFEISLFSYSAYSQSWEDFISHYKTLAFLNFDASAGGSGPAYDANNFRIDTSRLMTFSGIISRYVYGQQDVSISLKFQQFKGYVIAIGQILANNGSNATVWAKMQIDRVVIY